MEKRFRQESLIVVREGTESGNHLGHLPLHTFDFDDVVLEARRPHLDIVFK